VNLIVRHLPRHTSVARRFPKRNPQAYHGAFALRADDVELAAEVLHTFAHADEPVVLRPSCQAVSGSAGRPSGVGAQINHPDGGKPARVNQWTVSIQREVMSRTTVEVSYVGNRGTGLEANNLISYNATPLERFAERGLDLNNAADRQLLTSRIDSPLAAARGFGKPYPSYPGSAPSRRGCGCSRNLPTDSRCAGRRWGRRGTTRCTST